MTGFSPSLTNHTAATAKRFRRLGNKCDFFSRNDVRSLFVTLTAQHERAKGRPLAAETALDGATPKGPLRGCTVGGSPVRLDLSFVLYRIGTLLFRRLDPWIRPL